LTITNYQSTSFATIFERKTKQATLLDTELSETKKFINKSPFAENCNKVISK
jgi:hypothetical protein